MNLTPTEEVEQRNFVQYLELRGYKYFHVPNSTWTKSWSQKRKNMDMGVKPGVPDLFILSVGKYPIIAVEMKREKGGVVSPEQKEWLTALVVAGVPTAVCRGCGDAIDFVEETERL